MSVNFSFLFCWYSATGLSILIFFSFHLSDACKQATFAASLCRINLSIWISHWSVPPFPRSTLLPFLRSALSGRRLFFLFWKPSDLTCYCHALISVFPSSCVLTWPITFFLYVLLPGLTSCVSSASLPCLTVSPVLLPLSTSSPVLSSTNYSLSEWYALWCTFWSVCRNAIIRSLRLSWCPVRRVIWL